MTLSTARSLVFLAPLLFSCASTGVDRAEKAASAMRGARDALAETPAIIEAVSSSMETLSMGEGDMAAQYGEFSKALKSLKNQQKHIDSLSEKLEMAKTDFVDAWQERLATISDEDLREKASERRDAVVERFTSVRDELTGVSTDFGAWVQRVDDLHTYLENDLNPSGVQSVSKNIKSAAKDGKSLAGDIEGAVGLLDKLSERIAASKPAPPAEE